MEEKQKMFISKEKNNWSLSKNKIFTFLSPILFFPWIILSQDYSNITLLDNWHEDTILSNSSLVRYSGCWGFNVNGNNYAVIGST